ncbi:MAG: hypothetical protein ACN6PN_19750 [Sphingobacterium sp.]
MRSPTIPWSLYKYTSPSDRPWDCDLPQSGQLRGESVLFSWRVRVESVLNTLKQLWQYGTTVPAPALR